ncbi:MAG: anti-sigma regulatory factor [Methanobacteriaceae archaeon]|nr:anti-sigma regulatory factor [Methanobacteriaceae archaeon]
MKTVKSKKISNPADIITVSSNALNIAKKIGFSETASYSISIAVSELASNIHKYAKNGYIHLNIIEGKNTNGLEVVAIDNGPGIKNIQDAMKDNYSTSDGLGIGLPGVKRLMDEFEIKSEPKKGTLITTRKWL